MIGLTRNEQLGLLATVCVLMGAVGLHQWRDARRQPVIAVPGQGRWELIAEANAGARPELLLPPDTATAPAAAGLVDLNAAGADELDQALPGIGPARAKAIIELRTRLGGFQSVEQIDDVSGIGPATMERLRPLVRVGATSATAEALPTPAAPALAQPVIAPPPAPAATPAPALVDINSAGPEELDRLTGIGPALAARIIEDRRRNGPYRRVDDLERVSGIGPRTVEKLRHQAHVR